MVKQREKAKFVTLTEQGRLGGTKDTKDIKDTKDT